MYDARERRAEKWIKIGEFLKQLRKEKGLTQEQPAERFCVSRRSVSRWETGSNLPDVDILIEMADYYEVDLREIMDGERVFCRYLLFFAVCFCEGRNVYRIHVGFGMRTDKKMRCTDRNIRQDS